MHKKFTTSHEWILSTDGEVYKVGISEHAQSLLGDLVFVELPEVGQQFDKGAECAVVESVKTASDVYAPVAGEVVAINEALVDEPGTVNNAPYDEGWLFSLKINDAAELEDLMDEATYLQTLALADEDA